MGAETQVFGSLALLLVVLAALAFILFLVPIPLWIAAWASNAYVGLMTLIGMRFRRVPPGTVVNARIMAIKAGIEISINDLEAHFLAGGDVVRVVNAMISADKANIPMLFKRAAAIDLAGRDVLEAVRMSVLPKVIETPRITAVAKDGIQLIAVSRVTVRAKWKTREDSQENQPNDNGDKQRYCHLTYCFQHNLPRGSSANKA